jgi:cysteine sulfinate desulfinase/cysteine desulfurase-like protein
MNRKIALFSILGLLLLSIIGLGLYRYSYNQPQKKIVKQETSAVIKAVDLYHQFQQNKETARNKYTDKVIEVTGTIADVQNNGSLVVSLKTQEPIGVVSCKISRAEKEEMLRSLEGKDVTIKGRCACFRMDVNMVDCEVK